MAGLGIEAGVLNLLIGPKLADDFAKQLSDQVGGAVGPVAENASKSFSEKLSSGFTAAGGALTKSVTLPLVAVGGIAVKAGLDINKAFDSIRVGTGATGDTLDQLKKDFQTVATSTTGSFERVGAVIGDLNTRLGLTGEPLQSLAKQLLDLEQITGRATNIDTVTRILAAFQVPADQAEETFDRLFRASQATGVTFDALTTKLVSQSAAFSELGFGLDETAALLAQFEKAGVNTDTVLGALRVNIVKAAKEGQSAAEFFRSGVKEIEGFIASGDESAAQARASELFGARTFLDALDAIKRGQFNIDDTLAQIQNGEDTISGLAAETSRFPEELNKLGKSFAFALLPIAEVIIPVLTEALQAALPFIQKLADAFQNVDPNVRKVIVTVAGVAAALGPVLIVVGKLIGVFGSIIGVISKVTVVVKVLSAALLANPFALIAAAAVAAAILIFKNWDTIKAFFLGLWEKIKEPAEALWSVLTAGFETVANFILGIWGTISGAATAAFDAIVKAISTTVDIARPIIDALVSVFKVAFDVISTIVELWLLPYKIAFEVAKAVAEPVFEFLTSAFNLLLGVAETVWNGITTVISTAFGAIATVIQFYVNGIVTVVRTAFGIVETIVRTYIGIYQAIFGPIVDTFKTVFGFLETGARSAFGFITEEVGKVWSLLSDGATKAINFVIGLLEKLKNTLKTIRDAIKDLPGSVASSVTSIPGKAFGAVGGLLGFADGGRPPVGVPSIVGERGPEIFVPRTAGTIIPNDRLGQFGGQREGDSFNITINNPREERASTSIPNALREAQYLRG